MTAPRGKFHVGSDLRGISFAARRWIRRGRFAFAARDGTDFKIDFPYFAFVSQAARVIAVEPDIRRVAVFVVFELKLHFTVFKKRPVLLPFRHKSRNLLMIIKTLAGIEKRPEPINELIPPPDVEKSDDAGFVSASHVKPETVVSIGVGLVFSAPDVKVFLGTRREVNRDDIVGRFGIKLHHARGGPVELYGNAHRVAFARAREGIRAEFGSLVFRRRKRRQARQDRAEQNNRTLFFHNDAPIFDFVRQTKIR